MIFSRYCLHCQNPSKAHLCKYCGLELTLLDPPTDAAFPYYGPAATLINAIRNQYLPYLTKGLAAYLALQFKRLNYPKPDLIIPVPSPLLRSLKRGYNPAKLLAKSLAKLLNCPTKNVLKKHHGLPQTALSPQERARLSHQAITLRKKIPEGLTLLLIDDLIGTGTTLSHCRTQLLKTRPKAIYQLAICKDDF